MLDTSPDLLVSLDQNILNIFQYQGHSVIFPSGYAQEVVVKRAPKARAFRGVWGMLPQKMFILKGLGNAISHFFLGDVS